MKIKGFCARHIIVRNVVNTFIETEYNKKGKGIIFRYPVEDLLSIKQTLFISRPGHKKNFDFKVDVIPIFGFGEGKHIEIAHDLRKKKKENKQNLGIYLTQLLKYINIEKTMWIKY